MVVTQAMLREREQNPLVGLLKYEQHLTRELNESEFTLRNGHYRRAATGLTVTVLRAELDKLKYAIERTREGA